MRTLIGIDFSLNSPAFCSLRGNHFRWVSLTRSDRSEESLKKSKNKPFAFFSDVDGFELMFMNKEKMPDDYTERERIKIDYFSDLVERFWGSVKTHINPEDDVFIAIEGLSFASNGNALIDISMATALLRKKIVDQVGSSNFFVFSPTSVKKFAIKGNAKKDQLYEALINTEMVETNLSYFTNILNDNKGEWITSSGNVNKPLDDIIDATWICLFLDERLKED